MKVDIAKRWVKALRSGKYKQTKKALKITHGQNARHCCLGVLCELYQDEQKRKHGKPLATNSYPAKDFDIGFPRGAQIVEFTRNHCASTLPERVRIWAGMHDEEGGFREDRSVVTKDGKLCYGLAELNDSGVNFKRIADVIENDVNII